MYPHGRSLVEELKDKPFSLIGINSDPKSKLEEIIEDGTVTWECVWDGGSTRGPIATQWAVRGWPTIYILDHKGVIRFKDLRGEEMEHAVLKLLDGVPKKTEGEKKEGDESKAKASKE